MRLIKPGPGNGTIKARGLGMKLINRGLGMRLINQGPGNGTNEHTHVHEMFYPPLVVASRKTQEAEFRDF